MRHPQILADTVNFNSLTIIEYYLVFNFVYKQVDTKESKGRPGGLKVRLRLIPHNWNVHCSTPGWGTCSAHHAPLPLPAFLVSTLFVK